MNAALAELVAHYAAVRKRGIAGPPKPANVSHPALADHIAKPADKLAAAEADEQEFDLYLSAYKSAGG